MRETMQVIHKHMVSMSPGCVTSVETRAGAQALSTGFQDDILCLWERHDVDGEPTLLEILPVFTGQPAPLDGWLFAGTSSKDGLVWHVFWRVL